MILTCAVKFSDEALEHTTQFMTQYSLRFETILNIPNSKKCSPIMTINRIQHNFETFYILLQFKPHGLIVVSTVLFLVGWYCVVGFSALCRKINFFLFIFFDRKFCESLFQSFCFNIGKGDSLTSKAFHPYTAEQISFSVTLRPAEWRWLRHFISLADKTSPNYNSKSVRRSLNHFYGNLHSCSFTKSK